MEEIWASRRTHGPSIEAHVCKVLEDHGQSFKNALTHGRVSYKTGTFSEFWQNSTRFFKSYMIFITISDSAKISLLKCLIMGDVHLGNFPGRLSSANDHTRPDTFPGKNLLQRTGQAGRQSAAESAQYGSWKHAASGWEQFNGEN